MGGKAKNTEIGTDSRSERDNHQARLLSINTAFLEDIRIARHNFGVPDFMSFSWQVRVGDIYGERKYDDVFSCPFFDTVLDEENQKRFREEIWYIVKKYDLPRNFFSWVQWFVLYNEPMPLGIPRNLRLFDQILDDLGELARVPRTTEEKNSIIKFFRLRMGLPSTGRVPKEKSKMLKSIRSALDEKTLKYRKPRVDHASDFEVLNSLGRKKLYKNEGLEEEYLVKNTYRELAYTLKPEVEEEEVPQTVNAMRKRKERLVKQARKLKS